MGERRRNERCPECQGFLCHYEEAYKGFPRIDEVRCLSCGWRIEAKRKTDKVIPTQKEIKQSWS